MDKQCAHCKETKPVSDYPVIYDKKLGRERLYYICKPCKRAYEKERYRKRPELRKSIERRRQLKRSYGLTEEDYAAMVKKQKSKCAICKKDLICYSESEKVEAFIDHCHTTNKVRGLLCQQCNNGLGFFRDNIKSLRAAIYYLQKEG